jgi:hypothetical protein
VPGTSVPGTPVPGTSVPGTSVPGTSVPTTAPPTGGVGISTLQPSSSAMTSTSAPVPTAPRVPTSSPTISDDIFGVKQRTIDHDANERECSDALRALPQETVEEFEVSFEYGIESTSRDISDLIDEMESLILDFVATSVLRCTGDGNAQAVQLRSGGGGAVGYAGVVRIRYPEYGEVTSICEWVWPFVLCFPTHI